MEKKRTPSSSEEGEEKKQKIVGNQSTRTSERGKATMPPPSSLGARRHPTSFPASKLPFATPAAPETPFLPSHTSAKGSQEKRRLDSRNEAETDGRDGDDGVDESPSHSPSPRGGDTATPGPDMTQNRRGGAGRKIGHSDINLADTSLAALSAFPIALMNFERENGCLWDRNFFNRKLLYTLKSRWPGPTGSV